MLHRDRFYDRDIILLRGDVVYENSFLEAILGSPDRLFVNEQGRPVAAHIPAYAIDKTVYWLVEKGGGPDLPLLRPEQVGDTYRAALRKKMSPYAYILTNENKKELERKLFDQSYTGVTDLITKYVWPQPVYRVTRICAKLRITPNMIASAGFVLLLATCYFFWHGLFAAGLATGWLMTFLDTIESKLARITLAASEWGRSFRRGIDLVHPPLWYIAWGAGLYQAGLVATPPLLLLVQLLLFYVGGHFCEVYFLQRFNFPVHVWRRLDSLFRLVSARRNTSLILLTCGWLADQSYFGLLLVVLWHGLTFFIHLAQILHAEIVSALGHRPESWLKV